jgi:REP-associated tyrosine transposase
VPRANRNFCKGQVWHVTHRCHRKQFLLKFARDRRRWRQWLYVAQRRFGLSVLNYVATSNHVHLLLADQGNSEISRSMQLIAGRTAQEFNNRKSRKGAFWEDRYHATAVQTDFHLIQCITYIDLNMVRAKAVEHPSEWDICGYNEIQSPWGRKGVIDFDRLRHYLGVQSIEELADLQNTRLDHQIEHTQRDSSWTESIGVGEEMYVRKLKRDLAARGINKNVVDNGGTWILQDRNRP